MTALRLLLLPLLLLSPLAQASLSPAWEEVSRAEDVIVYRKEIPDSPVLAYKAKARIDAPLAKVVGVVRDTPRLKDWTYRVEHAEILKELSPTERIEYVHAATPWPVKDRDSVYRSTARYDKSQGRISLCLESVEHPARPAGSDRVRAHIFPSCFHFTTPDGGKSTLIEAEVHGDPKGAVPKWLVNRVQKRAPAASIRNLKKRLQTPGLPDDPLTLEFLKR